MLRHPPLVAQIMEKTFKVNIIEDPKAAAMKVTTSLRRLLHLLSHTRRSLLCISAEVLPLLSHFMFIKINVLDDHKATARVYTADAAAVCVYTADAAEAPPVCSAPGSNLC